MKRLFRGKGLPVFDTEETVIGLNNLKIETFLSHHLDAIRGLSNIYFIILDEPSRRLTSFEVKGVDMIGIQTSRIVTRCC